MTAGFWSVWAGGRRLACQRAPTQVGAQAGRRSGRAPRRRWGRPVGGRLARGLVCRPGGLPGGRRPVGGQETDPGRKEQFLSGPPRGQFFDDSIAKTARIGGNPGRNKNLENGQTPEGTKIGRAAQTGRLWTIWSSSSHRAARPGPVNDSRASPDRQAAGRPAAIGLASWLVALLQRAGRP